MDEGIYLVDKPVGWTSADVVRFLKKKLNVKKIGHAGTLDPAAGGLLVILTGNSTKLFGNLQKLPKEYIAEIKLGEETDTGDAEGKIITSKDLGETDIDNLTIRKLLNEMIGEKWQTPPIYSAVKIQGTPAYKLARRGKTPKLAEKRIVIYDTEFLGRVGLVVRVRFVVSSGTYIRQLAVDLGRSLGCGAHLVSLIRTRIGDFYLNQANKLLIQK